MAPELAVPLLILSLPFLLWALVTAGVSVSMWLANRWGRGDLMDTYQERVFLRRTVTLPQRMHGLGVEGFWQTIAFALQGLHIVRRFENPPLVSGGGPPVVLVAGYLENGGHMWLLARRLRARGYQTVVFDLPSTLRGIGANARVLSGEIERVLAATGAQRVALIGHSMGGVIMRACVHSEDAPPVAAVIGICSPHRGTHLAKLGFGQSARDMQPNSDHMRAHPASRLGRVRMHTLVSVQDNIVSPPWSTVLCEGENVLLELPVGHVAPLFMRAVEEQISDWLQAADFARTEAVVPSSVGPTDLA